MQKDFLCFDIVAHHAKVRTSGMYDGACPTRETVDVDSSVPVFGRPSIWSHQHCICVVLYLVAGEYLITHRWDDKIWALGHHSPFPASPFPILLINLIVFGQAGKGKQTIRTSVAVRLAIFFLDPQLKFCFDAMMTARNLQGTLLRQSPFFEWDLSPTAQLTSTLLCKILLPPVDDCNLFAKNETICGGSIQIHLREDSLQCCWWSVGRCRSIIDAITISFTAQLAHLPSAQVHICILPSRTSGASLSSPGELLCFNSFVRLVLLPEEGTLFQYFPMSGGPLGK